MNSLSHTSIGAIILAAGRGSRMKLQEVNKVTLLLGDKAIVVRIVELLKQVQVGSIVAVIGHAKESVIDALKGENVIFAEQAEQLGTGHAVQVGLEKVPEEIEDVIVIYGDDASFYPVSLIENLIGQHCLNKAAVSFITFTVSDPTGLGRVLRNENKEVIGIVEEKNASDEQKKICEVNAGCYIFNRTFLANYLPQVKKNPVSGEYYLTDMVELALANNEKVSTVEAGDLPWRGINTADELEEAQKFFNQINS